MNNHAVYIPKEIWCLPLPCEHRVLLAQIKYCCDIAGVCEWKNITFSKELGCTEYKVKKILKELEEAKYIHSFLETSCAPMWAKDKNTVYTKRQIRIKI